LLYIETDSKDAAFHFSVEEYFMQNTLSDETIIMLWQTNKCVMLGNYQVANLEVDLKYAQMNEMQIVRRSSGGGTIFTDPGTLLYSMISPCAEGQYPQQTARELLAASVIDMLNEIGISAQQEGRNDITANGKKVSGMAQYVRNNKVCSHCSLLYDADLEMLTRVLKADDDKIQSKAIRSIRSRVANLKEFMSDRLSTQQFWDLLRNAMFRKQDITKYSLSEQDLAGINTIYHEKYANTSWTFGCSPKFTFRNSKRFTGGRVDLSLDIVDGMINSCAINGDFLGTVPIRILEEALENNDFTYDVINETLSNISLYPYLGDITKDQLLSCMFD